VNPVAVKERAVRDRLAGEPLSVVAARHGVVPSTVWRWMRDMGKVTPRAPIARPRRRGRPRHTLNCQACNIRMRSRARYCGFCLEEMGA
jgi:hypothetical protein